jgi:prepilin-type N-terminal cleavage/methylation domain-containing protein/prepilin-type processing-associated H-X9-DG protein
MHYGIINKDKTKPISLTVPKEFRKRSIPKKGLLLHKENLPLSDLENQGTFMTTNLFKTLKDTKEELEAKERWKDAADKAYKSGKLTHEQLLQLGIISNSQPIKTITNYKISGDNTIQSDIKDEVYYRAQDAQKIFESMENQGRWAMNTSIYRKRNSQERGFTLVELLVVIAIISILAGMLLPALENALSSSRSIVCRSQHKQIYLGFSMYASESDDWLPMAWINSFPDGSWSYMLSPYIEGSYWTIPSSPNLPTDSAGCYYCPESEDSITQGPYAGTYKPEQLLSYTYNAYFFDPNWFPNNKKTISRIKKPSKILLISDMEYPSFSNQPIHLGLRWGNAVTIASWLPDRMSGHHMGTCNSLMVDGHVESSFMGISGFAAGTMFYDEQNAPYE